MSTRVTNQINVLLNLRYVQRQQQSLSALQQQVSSGIRIQKPSDDPLALRTQLLQQGQLERLESHQRATGEARLQLDQAHTDLLNAHDLFVRAQQLALQGIQATEAVDRMALANEVDALLTQMHRIANNTSSAGTLFAGSALDRDAYVTNLDGQFVYQGAASPTRLILGDGTQQPNLAPGSSVFETPGRGATLIEGTTGILPGAGTDTATGVRELIVEHTGTTIAGTSGLQSGLSATTGDTLVGTQQLLIADTSGTGAAGTIAFQNGSTYAFTNADTDLEIIGPNGERLYVDTTAIVPGFSGLVTVQGQGRMSIDGGNTFSPIAFSANETLVDSRDNSTVNLNTSTVQQAGVDRIELQATSDAFETLQQLRDDLMAASAQPSSVSTPRLERRLGDVVRIQDHILDEIGTQSVRLQNLDRLDGFFEDQISQTRIDLSEGSATDIPAAVIQLQQVQQQYQYTLASLARLYETSLLTYVT